MTSVLVVSGLLLVTRWTILVLAVDLAVEQLWVYSLALPCLVALVTAFAWYPGDIRRWLGGRSHVHAWIFAGVAAAGLTGLTLWSHRAGTLDVLPTTPFWVATAIAGILVEELVFRGLVFAGIDAVGGRKNAAVASSLIYGIVVLHPIEVVAGILASITRAVGGTVLPGIALRVLALLVGLWLL